MTPPSTIASCLNRRWDRPSVRSCSAHVARIEQSEIRGTAFKLVGRPRVSLRSTRATNKKEAERRETRSPSSAPFPVALARLRERVSTPTGFVGLNQQSSSQPCSNPQFPGPPGEWCQAEFNVFGLVGGSQAQFNAGTTITVTNALNLAFGPPISASCPAPPKGMGTTGESNNLNLGSTCSVSVLPVSNRNQISFTESLASGTATNQITATLNGNGAGGPATGLTFDAGPPSKSLCQNPISTDALLSRNFRHPYPWGYLVSKSMNLGWSPHHWDQAQCRAGRAVFAVDETPAPRLVLPRAARGDRQ